MYLISSCRFSTACPPQFNFLRNYNRRYDFLLLTYLSPPLPARPKTLQIYSRSFLSHFNFQMRSNPNYMCSEADMEANHSREENYFNEKLLVSHSTPLAAWADRCDQETEKRMSNHSSTQPLINHSTTRFLMFDKRQASRRTATNTHRERVRQKRIREAFDVLRSVIPDYFSRREPGDKLTRIKTLRLAKNYIVMLHELLERSP